MQQPRFGIRLALALVLSGGLTSVGPAAEEAEPEPTEEEEQIELDPRQVRSQALEKGLRSLRAVEVPEPDNLDEFLRPGDDARTSAIELGKALFWDMQVGSDGQACGSCHFHAGADDRTKNQLSPGLKHTDSSLQHRFEPSASGDGGPNYDLTEDDFPFHQLEEPENRTSAVLHDSDDVCSSQGVFNADFMGIKRGRSADVGRAFPDPVFHVGGINVRRVEPRNTPTMINAVFNFANFWDGRAHNVFNGASPLGPLDEQATILVHENGGLVRTAVRINNSSLASQAVGPPGSDLEMSFGRRPLREVARKLLSLRPLGLQRVHPDDSVLGGWSRARLERGKVVGKKGLSVSYTQLIKRAFRHRYWESNERVDGYSQLENNFSLFLGLAIQMYESTLVSDRAPFDKFMEGEDDKLSQDALRGLQVFVGKGNCVSCHGGAEFTDAAFSNLGDDEEGLELIENEEAAELSADVLAIGAQTTFIDNGFSNIGVRPTGEDLGRGGMELGHPLSFVRQRLAGLPFAPELPACGGADQLPCPADQRMAVDGAFKIPSLRNVSLTGPYFHNGGQATLGQVIEFYDRQGDFTDGNIANLDPNMARIDLDEDDEEPLISFLISLTDHRVRREREPFDHPQLFVPNGHRGDHALLKCVRGVQACDSVMEIPATGEDGLPALGLPELKPFLGIDHLADD